jgi:CelD/BcsL family acetyltransferase involved in cellulose biosynthesis
MTRIRAFCLAYIDRARRRPNSHSQGPFPVLAQTATSDLSQLSRPHQRMLEIEFLSAPAAAAFAEAWADLARRSIESNIFFEPEFALPALAHLDAGQSVRVVCVWDSGTNPRQLVAVLPLALPLLSLRGMCRAWVHKQAVLGTPLLDRTCARAALEAMFTAIGRRYPYLAVLLLPQIPTAGPTFALLEAFATQRQRRLTLFGAHERAVLRRPFEDPLSSGAASELRRHRRRLAETGRSTYRSRRDRWGVVEGMEEFLAFEARGWKGRNKSALVSAPATAAFARHLAQTLGQAGKLHVDSLEFGGQPVAMGVVLQSGAYAYFWKIAYDEAQAGRSPGVLFTQDLTRQQIADSNLTATDSCAIPDHPMINRLWPDRMALADVAVPLQASQAFVGAALLGETFRRTMRRTAKHLREQIRAYLRK